MRSFLLSVAALVLVATHAVAGEGWIADLEEGFAEARATGRHLLVDFTGSDWCPPCKRLDAELLSQDSFKRLAGESFVLVSLDYPRRTPQSAELKAANAKHAKTYGVGSFPTLIVMTPEGLEYGRRTGYQPGNASAYRTWVMRLSDHRETVIDALAVLEEAVPADESARAAWRTRKVDAAASLVMALGVDAPERATMVLQLHDPKDTTLAQAHLALLGFEARSMQDGGEPNFEKMLGRLDTLATSRPTVEKLGAYHAWRALASSQTGKANDAKSALQRARDLKAPPALLSWVESVVDRG